MEPAAKKKSRLPVLIAIGIVAAVAIALLLSAAYSIREQEQAVVVTLGTPAIVSTPGLHFRVPFVQEVHIVSTEIAGFSIGYDMNTGASIEKESLMITLDYNFVNVDFFLEYRVSDPEKYLYNSRDPVFILKNLAQSYIRDTIGLYQVDSVITTGKNEIQAEIKEKIIGRLAQEDIGLQLINITIQDATPPTEAVLEAFKAVETAKQGKDTAINNANKYRSEQVPAASAQVDSILKSAEAKRQARINEAEGQVARFNSMYEQYRLYPLITKQRMYYEAMEEILPGLRVFIDSGDGTTSKLLPLAPFSGGEYTSEGGAEK